MEERIHWKNQDRSRGTAVSGPGGTARARSAARAAVHAVILAAALAGIWSRPDSAAAAGDARYGPFGPEGARFREQLWILPGGDPDIALRATVFRPPRTGSEHVAGVSRMSRPVSTGKPAAATGQEPRRPLAIVNHGTDPATREAVSMPVFYWLSRWFVERGYVVVLPQRRGHGATGGPLAEAQDSCAAPRHYEAGQIAADDIEAALRFMTSQPFVQPEGTIVAGVSTGGWAALALASRNPRGVAGVVNFAGGRGGRPHVSGGNVCGRKRLIRAAGAFGRTARVPTLWLYAGNDRFFNPRLVTSMANAWRRNGGRAELHILPAYGSNGHRFVEGRAGWDLWGPAAEAFLARHGMPAVRRAVPPPPSTADAATGTRKGDSF